MTKEYRGTVYLGVVGPEDENGVCRDSILNIRRRPGDEGPRFIRGTKGYETRQMHINNFIASHHDFILLLDHDMVFPSDTLERLRSHALPYVSGYYMRRRYAPIAPVWFKYGPKGKWPMEPFTADPKQGKLIKLGASGWGCILLHREVIISTREVLKGEPEVIEDDMDVWPYDLKRVMRALAGLQELVHDKPQMKTLRPALAAHTSVLIDEIRPLRVTKDAVGSDIRFPFYARYAGFDLWGDPDVRCGHMLNYPLHPDDYTGLPQSERDNMIKQIRKKVTIARRQYNEALAELGEK